MGAPAFQCKDLFRKHKMTVLSSNYTLYGDMSRRFIHVLHEFAPEVEVYSIDEAFLYFKSEDVIAAQDWLALGKKIRNVLQQWLGLPVSVGIAPTKTLAKAACELIKKIQISDGVFEIGVDQKSDDFLDLIPIQNVWGVGHRYAKTLQSFGVKTALDLKNKPAHWVRKKMTVMGERTHAELRGVSCIGLEDVEPVRKSIVCSRSFGRGVYKKEDLKEAIATYLARGSEKLRQRKLLANRFSVYLKTNPHQVDFFRKLSWNCALNNPTNMTSCFIEKAFEGLDKHFQDGLCYKKAGVMFYDLVPEDKVQYHLFDSQVLSGSQKKLMAAMDRINAKWGGQTIQHAAEGLKKEWRMRREFRTPNYTTSWKQLLTVKASRK